MTTHLQHNNISYFKHLKRSLVFSLLSLKASLYFFIHSFFPNTFVSNGSETINYIDNKLRDHKKFRVIKLLNDLNDSKNSSEFTLPIEKHYCDHCPPKLIGHKYYELIMNRFTKLLEDNKYNINFVFTENTSVGNEFADFHNNNWDITQHLCNPCFLYIILNYNENLTRSQV